MRRVLMLSTVALCSSLAFADVTIVVPTPHSAPPPPADVAPRGDRPLVQVALLLDTSNSMDGLINQARTQLWTIVNEIGRAKRDGRLPRLQVALIEYGNDRLAAGEGYIRTVLPFTDNLDDVSEKLFALTTNGGSEFCGQAIGQATTTLAWSSDPKVYKTIFIAGNEPFGQGTVDYRTTCAAAIGRGIVVNTIHCGSRDDGVNGQWADGARRGEGSFSNIDQDRAIRVMRCPQDERIEKLSIEINVTYVPYGPRGMAAAENQVRQDVNAQQNVAAAAPVARAASKAGANYENAGWDLVDAVEQKKVDLATLDAATLPEAMRKMTPDERKAYVAEQSAKRTAIRAEIQKLMAERAAFLAEQQKSPAAKDTLDAAIVGVVRDQLKAREFEVEAK